MIADGNLRDWWTEEDAQRFTERADMLSDEYSSYVAIDDIHLEGKLTLGENIADLGGLKLGLSCLYKITGREKV